MFPSPEGKDNSGVHPSTNGGHVNNDGMDTDTGVSKPNAMGSRTTMMRDYHIFRCIDVGGSNHGYMSYPSLCFSTLLH